MRQAFHVSQVSDTWASIMNIIGEQQCPWRWISSANDQHNWNSLLRIQRGLGCALIREKGTGPYKGHVAHYFLSREQRCLLFWTGWTNGHHGHLAGGRAEMTVPQKLALTVLASAPSKLGSTKKLLEASHISGTYAGGISPLCIFSCMSFNFKSMSPS